MEFVLVLNDPEEPDPYWLAEDGTWYWDGDPAVDAFVRVDELATALYGLLQAAMEMRPPTVAELGTAGSALTNSGWTQPVPRGPE